ncbi:protein FAR1-RELATED SEQUENCE 5-like [Daucus carota subsp. sativus]|uniref:protein FAR1-RELATED SEQUENCE 5-like n=1 Tax=Daucus carota subsp. sativus TaxID=79200 RepID=UPI0030827D1C
MASSSNQGNLHNSCNRYSDLQVDSTANNNDFTVECARDDEVENFIEGFDDSFSSSSGLSIPKVDDNKVKPYSGQIFRDIETCFKFYAEYGRQGGFDIRKSSQKVRDGIVVYKYFVCSKGGDHETSMSKNSDSNSDLSLVSSTAGVDVRRRRRTVTKKCQCEAKVQLKYGGFNQYIIFCFVEDAAKSNIGAHRAHSLYKSIAGSYTDVGATATDFQNWVRDIKLYIGKHDADMLLQNFQNKRETSDAGFAYEYETDSDGHLTRLFWADIPGRQSVDNHWKSVTFASALLNDEDSTNFTWVCEMFLKVFQQAPKCIITDQCPAMKVAINKIFPNSIHRYCMWHIMQKFTAKVGPVFCAESGFVEKLNKFVWSSHLTISKFEEGWNFVLNKFGLSEHVWLNEMYLMRESWIPAFFRDKPMGALLRTTSRSESSNFFFNHFVQRRDTLSEFYICYESAIEKQIYENKKLNDGDRCIPKTITEKEIEKEAAQLYTRTMFYKVQKQIKASCFHISLAGQPIVVDGVSKYIVRDKTYDEKYFEVQFSFLTNNVECSCKLFTRVGYLCRHCFYCLGLWGVERIPYQYLCSRWMRNAEDRFCKSKFSDVMESTNVQNIRDMSKKVWTVFQGCIEYVSNNANGMQFLFDEMNSLKIRVEEKFESSRATKEDMLEECFGVRPSTITTVHPPLQSNNKGSRKRLVGPAEKSCDGKKRKLRVCKFCMMEGYHDSRTCLKKKMQNPIMQAANICVDHISTNETINTCILQVKVPWNYAC